MKIIHDFPHKVQVTDHQWITMDDGTRLSARLWIPEAAYKEPVPVIFEFIPYRKYDFTRARDDKAHGYYSGHGYACIRVDLRGSGNSEGLLDDEYTQRELDDAVNILKWLGEQPWCNGNVGMMGISWGGFNALQVAALQPPELKAIISVAFTDDRYADDIHYMGGCLLGDNLSWSSVMFGINALPPNPDLAGEGWRDMWMERLEHNKPWLARWLEHQARDEYWKHGSVCEDYSNVQCPVMAISGWADGYTNAVFRTLEHLDVPRLGLVGPWAHKYPHLGQPGPAVGYLQESLRWWDRWLRGEDNGIMDGPMLRAYMQHSAPPQTSYDTRPGRWVAEKTWPAPNIQVKNYVLREHLLSERGNPAEEKALSVCAPLSHGMFAGKWCSYATCPDMPADQRLEDGSALVFETDPLEQAVEILGAPVVKLSLSVDKPAAMVVVRLSDIDEEGKATRVSYGLLNLTQRNNREHPEALEPGCRYEINVPMNHIAQRFEKNHRIRLSVANSYFPLAWLSPEPVTLEIYTERSSFQLPVRNPDEALEISHEDLGEPVSAKTLHKESLRPPYYNWEIHYDLAADKTSLVTTEDNGTSRYGSLDINVSDSVTETYSVTGNDCNSACGEVSNEIIFDHKAQDIRTRTNTHTILTSDSKNFYIRAELNAFENEENIFSREWDFEIPRRD